MPKFRCEHCRQKIAAPDDYGGRRVRCPRCKQPVQVPQEVDALAEAVPTGPQPPDDVPAAPAAAAAEVSPPDAVAPKSAGPAGPQIPSAAPFLGAVQDPIFTQRADADLSSLFGESEDGDFPENPHDLSPEEQTQTFWHLHEVAGYHDAPEPPFASSAALRPEPVIEAPADEFRAAPEPTPDAVPETPQESEWVEPPERPPAPDPVILEPTEVIDAPVQRRRPGLNSADEVADLLRRLDKPDERARRAAEWVVDQQQRTPPRGSRWIGVLGWMSLLVGAGSIALAFQPAQARFAVPAAVGGVVLAITGLVLALGKRARVLVPVGGTFVSCAGVVVAVLIAEGLLPPSKAERVLHPPVVMPVTFVASTRPASPDDQGTLATPADYVLATSPLIANGVQVRVVSALVLRPAVYTGQDQSPHTWLERRLQITLELKNAGTGDAVYTPWRNTSDGSPVAQVTDGSGAVLAINERPYEAQRAVPQTDEIPVLAVGALRGAIKLTPTPRRDVLLFPAPADASGDLLLDLPGRNIGAPDLTLHIRIPAPMVRVQS